MQPRRSRLRSATLPRIPGITPAGKKETSAPVAHRDRTDPAHARPHTWKSLALDLWHGFFRTGVTSLATQFAYSLLFASFPVLLMIMSLSALADRVFEIPVAPTLRDWIDESAPIVLKPVLRQLVDKAITEASTGIASVSAGIALLLAIWGASGAVGTLMAASMRAYGIKNSRHFFVRRLINSMLALLVVVFIVLAVIFFLFGKEIGHPVLEWLGFSTREALLLGIFRFGLFFIFTMLALVILYRVGTDIELNPYWLLPGAAFGTLLWFALLQGFSAILMVTNPGDPYGTFGAVVILLWFFYLTGVSFLVGTVINAVISRPYDKKRRADFVRHPERRMFCDDGTEA